MKTIISNNIIIREREEESLKGMYLYCEVIGTRWFNRCKLPENKKMQKGTVFNVYRVEYVTDERGRLSIDEHKYGCEFDGRSIETSLLALDEHINENDYLRRQLVPNSPSVWAYWKPLEVFLFDRHWFTEQQADYTDHDLACTLADAPKDRRHVWRYSLDCQTFAADMERGAIDLSLFHIRTM